MTQREKIIMLLEEKGTVSNYELNPIAYRYAARINELRKDGYNIKAKHDKGSRWLFTLIKEPVQEAIW